MKFGYLPVFIISTSSYRVFKIVADTLSALGKPETKNAKVIQQQATVKSTCVCFGVASHGLASPHHRVEG